MQEHEIHNAAYLVISQLFLHNIVKETNTFTMIVTIILIYNFGIIIIASLKFLLNDLHTTTKLLF